MHKYSNGHIQKKWQFIVLFDTKPRKKRAKIVSNGQIGKNLITMPRFFTKTGHTANIIPYMPKIPFITNKNTNIWGIVGKFFPICPMHSIFSSFTMQIKTFKLSRNLIRIACCNLYLTPEITDNLSGIFVIDKDFILFISHTRNIGVNAFIISALTGQILNNFFVG